MIHIFFEMPCQDEEAHAICAPPCLLNALNHGKRENESRSTLQYGDEVGFLVQNLLVDSTDDAYFASSLIFGSPLQVAVEHAGTAFYKIGADGQLSPCGRVPVVVAECGGFLRKNATEVEGIFRLNGSFKRMKHLQALFEDPSDYGEGLDWAGFTVHDAAGILRRYLNQLSEPVVPLSMYERFKGPMIKCNDEEKSPKQADLGDTTRQFVSTYWELIRALPSVNQDLFIYILNLLAKFCSKSDYTRMTAENLAAAFQPAILSHPAYEKDLHEYESCQTVLSFLIQHQAPYLPISTSIS